MSKEKPRRPDGVGAIAVLAFISGLYTIYGYAVYGSFYGLNADATRAFGVPIEFLIVIVLFVLGFAEVINGFGLWTGKSYAYWLSLIIPIFAVVYDLALTSLYASAPSELKLTSNYAAALVNTVGWVIWLFICWWYLKKPYVRTYLGRSKSNMNVNISDSNL